MVENLVIREAKERDVNYIMKLYGDTIWKIEQSIDCNLKSGFEISNDLNNMILEDIKNDDNVILVAEVNGIIIGYINALVVAFKDAYVEPIATITELAVSYQFKRLGIGKLLLDECIKKLKDKGIGYVKLTFFEQNEDAKLFYENNGFEPYSVTYRRKV